MNSEYSWLHSAYGSVGDAQSLYTLAHELEVDDNPRLAAIAYDRAYALAPENQEIAEARKQLLDKLAVVEHGLRFRYIPAGTFLMGSHTGDPDEQPVHPVKLAHYWLSETPISWATYADLMGWETPPYACPLDIRELGHGPGFWLNQQIKIRLQYCEDATTRAIDWHAHAPDLEYVNLGTGKHISSRTMYGEPSREDPRRPWQYDRKPMVCVSWQEAEELCQKISRAKARYHLPTEAQWEKAARGGLINCSYPWGNEPPDEDRCDFNRFDRFSIFPMRRFPPNGYGLYATSGCIWEWTSDWYDADFYTDSPTHNPQGPPNGVERTLRGGSWSDCSEAITVSFRMSRKSIYWRIGDRWGGHFAPNIGFRLCRSGP